MFTNRCGAGWKSDNLFPKKFQAIRARLNFGWKWSAGFRLGTFDCKHFHAGPEAGVPVFQVRGGL